MNPVPRRLLAIAIPAAVGATVATVMLVGSHGAATPPVSRLVQRADTTTTDTTTATATTDTSASPTPVPTATLSPAPTQTLIACGDGTYAEFACKRDLPTPTPVPTPTPAPCPGFPGYYAPCHPAGTVDLGSGLWIDPNHVTDFPRLPDGYAWATPSTPQSWPFFAPGRSPQAAMRAPDGNLVYNPNMPCTGDGSPGGDPPCYSPPSTTSSTTTASSTGAVTTTP